MGRCADCESCPVTRCGRCSVGLCRAHVPARSRRCRGCEAEYAGDNRSRRALQHMFAPPVFVLAGGLTFGLLLPLLFILPFTIGAAVVATIATSVGFGAASGTCHLVEATARAQFLRETRLGLPEMRVLKLPAPR